MIKSFDSDPNQTSDWSSLIKIYATSDLHLAISTPSKEMSRFGSVWENHTQKIQEGWKHVGPSDIVIIAGDISWSSNINKCREDFDFIEALPGKKILTIGNHDFWHQTATKTNEHLFDNYRTIVVLTANDYFNLHDQVAICSVKGYMNETHPEFKDEYRKGYSKECTKLENTLKIIPSVFTTRILVSHYPPIHKSYHEGDNQILKVMQTYSVSKCIYGHLHGKESSERFEGMHNNIDFLFVAADSFNFTPRLVHEV